MVKARKEHLFDFKMRLTDVRIRADLDKVTYYPNTL